MRTDLRETCRHVVSTQMFQMCVTQLLTCCALGCCRTSEGVHPYLWTSCVGAVVRQPISQ